MDLVISIYILVSFFVSISFNYSANAGFNEFDNTSFPIFLLYYDRFLYFFSVG